MRAHNLLWLILVGFTAPATAGPLLIDVHSARFTTTLRLTTYVYDYVYDPISDTSVEIVDEDTRSRIKTSASPIHDSIIDSYGAEVTSSANVFAVSASAETYEPKLPSGLYATQTGRASALTELVFSPREDALAQDISLHAVGRALYWYSDALVRLVDITEGKEVWRLWWTDEGGLYFGEEKKKSFKLPTTFTSSHVYALSMYTGVGSDHDGEGMTLRMAVPEPATLILMGIGALGVLVRRSVSPHC